jgi:hypothetical protein
MQFLAEDYPIGKMMFTSYQRQRKHSQDNFSVENLSDHVNAKNDIE